MTDRQRQMHEHLDRPVAGADLAPDERPGIPMEHQARPLTPTAPEQIEHMRPRRGLTHRKELRSMTPVFGTAQPLHGLSYCSYCIRTNAAPPEARLLRAVLESHPGRS